MEREIRLKRLYFRSAHRGSKEADLILEPFAKSCLPSMDEAALKEFEAFLGENDNDIWDWVSGKAQPGEGRYRQLLDALRKTYAISG